MDNRIYRKLTISDLELIMRIKNYAPDFSVDRENLRQFLSNPMNWSFACVQDNEIIGHAYGYEQMNFYNSGGNRLYIHGLGVNERYRRQGVATGILTGIKEASRLLGIYKIFLITQKSNIAACGLYEKLGGKIHPESQDDDRAYFFNPLS